MAERAGSHSRFAVRLAWGLAAVSLPAAVAATVLFVLDRAAIDTSTLVNQAGWLANGVVCTALGLLIVVRRPSNTIGWMLLGVGTANLLLNLPEEFAAIRGLQTGAGRTGWVAWCTWMVSWSGIAGGILLGFIIF